MLQDEIAVTPTELNVGLLASTTTSELQPPGITILYVYCEKATEQLHTHHAGLVVTWLKLTTQLSTVLRGEHRDNHY